MQRFFRSKKSHKTGMIPGIPVYVGDQKAQKTSITAVSYDAKKITKRKIKNIEECKDLEKQQGMIWLNITGLSNSKLIAEIGKLYKLHPLIIEDVLNTEQRPKLDIFANYIFLTMKRYDYDAGQNALAEEQISLVFGKNFLITFQETSTDTFENIYARLKNPDAKLRQKGVDYLAHALIDITVDSYFSIIEQVGDYLEDIEEKLVTNPNPKQLKDIHALKREMIFLRRAVWPLREVISGMQRSTSDLIAEDTAIYLKDIYDHTIQVIDTVETYRDLLSGMLDLYISTTSNRMNEIMKVLTVFASIFIPLTFITGLYGMNFSTASHFNMPELGWKYGYFFALGLMGAVAIAMAIFFKRRKWW